LNKSSTFINLYQELFLIVSRIQFLPAGTLA
jgi:hypothetical protein